jgi:hypothetical protein
MPGTGKRRETRLWPDAQVLVRRGDRHDIIERRLSGDDESWQLAGGSRQLRQFLP